jgi:high-affinity iron transporter
MGLTMLRMDRAREKWRVKLSDAFEVSYLSQLQIQTHTITKSKMGSASGKNGKWVLFILPFITVLREGLEAVVFIGGVCCFVYSSSVYFVVTFGLFRYR